MAIALVSALVCLALAAAAAVLVWVIQAALHARVRRARIVRREVVADYLTCLPGHHHRRSGRGRGAARARRPRPT